MQAAFPAVGASSPRPSLDRVSAPPSLRCDSWSVRSPGDDRAGDLVRNARSTSIAAFFRNSLRCRCNSAAGARRFPVSSRTSRRVVSGGWSQAADRFSSGLYLMTSAPPRSREELSGFFPGCRFPVRPSVHRDSGGRNPLRLLQISTPACATTGVESAHPKVVRLWSFRQIYRN
jgi:hypothetical protein